MEEDGYRRYKEFVEEPPLLCIEWNDSETEAIGWLVINSLRNGAAGGGTRMRLGGTKEECTFLAKTMEIKFAVSGPPIGGAKSVINFDPNDPRKQGVLERWFESIAPYLRSCYGTAGDLNVTFEEVAPILRRLDIFHPQEGVVRGYVKPPADEFRNVLSRLGLGVGLQVPFENDPKGPLNIEQMITGYSLARALHYYYEAQGEQLGGKKVLIEGFGTVGRSAAYQLAEAGATVVGICSRNGRKAGFRWAVEDVGLDVVSLIRHCDGLDLPIDSKEGLDLGEFWSTRADIFVPAAISHSITRDTVRELLDLGVRVIACGANNPFYINWTEQYGGIAQLVDHALETQQDADISLAIIPDFIANCGVARLFAYLMSDAAEVDPDSIFKDVDHTIQDAMNRLLLGTKSKTRLLTRAYTLYVG